MPVRERFRGGRVGEDELRDGIYSTVRDRVNGYFEALREHGIDTATVPVMETYNNESTVRAAMEAIFAADDPPTAILAQSDRAALFAITWLRERGMDVPRDVSVIGFDGIAEGAASSPPLTSVAQPMRETGRRAVAAVLEADGTVRREVLPLQLVVRGSTAAPRR
jgi:DNA-binding LacI/PurR family transcriptional regulator